MLQLLYSGVSLPSADDLKEQMEQLKDTDALTQALKELAGDFPSISRPLIHERDEYMVARLRLMGMKPGVENVVAVVGAGHCPGMREKWEAEIELDEITRMPPAEDWNRTRKVLLYGTGLAVTGTVLTVVCGSVYVALRLVRRR